MSRWNRAWTALCVACLVPVCGVAAQSGREDAETLAAYRLTDEGVEKFAQASRNLSEAIRQHPELEGSMDGSGESSLAETAALIDAQPVLRNAINEAGMESEEYVTFMFSLFQAGVAAWVVEEYGPGGLPEGTPRENVDYYLANRQKLTALGEEMQKQSGPEAERED